MRTIAFLSLSIVMGGCAPPSIVRNAHLYPANDQARADGVLVARIVAHGTGHGEVAITLPDGEVASGEFSIVRGGAIGFGSLYGSVYGSGGAASFSGASTTNVIPGASEGTASAFGTTGTSVDCEFYNDNRKGHGMGACRSSKGALYRLQY